MRRRRQNRQPQSETLAARIDHAAEEINPFLAVIAVGLVVLNLIALALLAPRLSATRGGSAAQVRAIPAPQLGAIPGAR